MMEKRKTFFLAILTTGYFSYVFAEITFKDMECDYYIDMAYQEKRVCSIRVSPICASNNITYPNSCVLCFVKLATNFNVKIKHSGKCKP
ncbi:ovomucoid-like [Erinaceus europaeus]|uniref:Ovomucoid-like n=1 Tax=Erinaceus europaeus TaxID=9365 RepID=A0ABM3X0P4_ERIEU|nr:ovomucoid-like [Erinaceus europaeus]